MPIEEHVFHFIKSTATLSSHHSTTLKCFPPIWFVLWFFALFVLRHLRQRAVLQVSSLRSAIKKGATALDDALPRAFVDFFVSAIGTFPDFIQPSAGMSRGIVRGSLSRSSRLGSKQVFNRDAFPFQAKLSKCLPNCHRMRLNLPWPMQHTNCFWPSCYRASISRSLLTPKSSRGAIRHYPRLQIQHLLFRAFSFVSSSQISALQRLAGRRKA